MSIKNQTPTPQSAPTLDPVTFAMAIGLPLKVGEWLPGYYGEIAVQHKNGTWSISHSNTVDPTAEWTSPTDSTKKSTGPEMSRDMGYVAWVPLGIPLSTAPAPAPASQDAAVAAIAFALDTDDGLTFLHLWNEGEFDTLRREWPEAPDAIYIGADPLHPSTKAASMPLSGGFVPVGTLSVFEDKEATFGHAYDISTNFAGHKTLQTLDGAQLYAVAPAPKAAQ